jgi:hypothetical protein
MDEVRPGSEPQADHRFTKGIWQVFCWNQAAGGCGSSKVEVRVWRDGLADYRPQAIGTDEARSFDAVATTNVLHGHAVL